MVRLKQLNDELELTIAFLKETLRCSPLLRKRANEDVFSCKDSWGCSSEQNEFGGERDEEDSLETIQQRKRVKVCRGRWSGQESVWGRVSGTPTII